MNGPSPAPARAWRSLFLAGAAIILVVLTFTFGVINNANVYSRLATAESLVERGTFAIDGASFNTIDKVFVRGHFYSEKPPLLAVLAAAVYAPLHAAGLRMTGRLAPTLIVLVVLGSSYLLCLWCFLDACARAGLSRGQQAFATSILAVGTLYLPWNTTFNNHGFVASWLFIGLYCWLRARGGDWDSRWTLLCGGALAVAGAVDYSVIPFQLLLCGLTLLQRRWRVSLRVFMPLLITMVPSLLFNYLISGTLRPLQIQTALFRYPGSYWLTSQEHLSGVGYNSASLTLSNLWLMLIVRDGFLIYNPVLAVAIIAALVAILRRKKYWQEAAVVLLFATLFVGYYCMATTNFGGFNYSIRWFAELIPIVWFFAFPVFRRITFAKAIAIGLLFAASATIALVGTVNPWQGERPGFYANMYRLLPGAKE